MTEVDTSAAPTAPAPGASTGGTAAASGSPSALSARLGHEFGEPELLALAVTHRSFCAENAGHVSNERLEFLGDAVLGIVVTDHIFSRYPEMPEGELAKLRASVVSAATLAEVAQELQLGAAVRLGKGEDASGGREKRSILADAMEAVFGAVYLDGGMEAVRPLILGLLDERIRIAAVGPGGLDFKTQLQELAARNFEQLPVYELQEEGPDHEKRFFATVWLNDVEQGRGEGRSKKLAEQAAARDAWERLAGELTGAPAVAALEAAGDAGSGGPVAVAGESVGTDAGAVEPSVSSVPDGDAGESEVGDA